MTESESKFYAAFKRKLLPKETLISVVDNLSFGFYNVPHAIPSGNYSATVSDGGLALTSHRIIALWKEGQGWKTLHIPSLSYFSERKLRTDKPNWPYQAIMAIPGGLILVAQTQQPNAEHGKQLSLLLNNAIVRFSVIRDDTGSIASIISYEEEKAKSSSNQDDNYRKEKEE